jgi:CubicO group peptidase (beta-lactamase class C family)
MSFAKLALLVFIGMSVSIAQADAAAVGQTNPTQGDSDVAVADFLNSEVPRLMAQMDIPGSVVVLVSHDRVVLNAGFGVSDVARSHAVDPAKTVFRIASVSKVFTALAALQLVDERKVGLTDDLTPLLSDVLQRNDNSAPLTLHQLLTHTAGFDEQLVGYMNPASSAPEPLRDYLARSAPSRSRMTVGIPGYSNYGYALIGLLVERVSGQPFDLYVHDKVFQPLGMANTRFILEPEQAGNDLTVEYRSDGLSFPRRSSRAYPAGNVGTTGADMAVFLQWLLSGLRGESLSTQANQVARQLVEPMLIYHPALPGMGYGLSGVPMSGRVVWMKGGAGPFHSAVVAVIPDLDLGIFVALNRQEPLLWDRLLPSMVAKFRALPDAVKNGADTYASPRFWEGTYRWTRAPLGSIEKVLGLAVQLRVISAPTGISVTGFRELSGEWQQTGDATFKDAKGRVLAFGVATGSAAPHLFSLVQGQPVSFERVTLSETARFQSGALLFASIFVLMAMLTGLWRRKTIVGLHSLRWPLYPIIGLPLCMLGVVGVVVVLAGQGEMLVQQVTTSLRIALALTTITAGIAVLQAAACFRLTMVLSRSFVARAIFLLGGVGGCALALLLASNNLVILPSSIRW